jgi:hypothetical protein
MGLVFDRFCAAWREIVPSSNVHIIIRPDRIFTPDIDFTLAYIITTKL